MRNKNLSTEAVAVASQFNKERDYWLNKLSGELTRCSFPYDYRNSDVRRDVQNEKFTIGGEVFSKLITLSNDVDHIIHMCLLASVVSLLHEYTGINDIIIGVPIYRQEKEEAFINTVLVIRNKLDDDMSFKEVLIQVRETILEANENLNYPIDILLNNLNMTLTQEDFPLFDIVVLLKNIHDRSYISHINTNMIFSFLKTSEHIEATVEYSTGRYNKITIERIIKHFLVLMEKVIGDVNIIMTDIEVLSEQEKKQLLIDFNNTVLDKSGRDKTVDRLFDEQVERTSDRVAVLSLNCQLTYRELKRSANRLARVLATKGVQLENIVGIMVKRSVEMIIAILSILKTGAAYLPIDPEYPDARKKFILEDSHSMLLITQSPYKINSYDQEIIYVKDNIYYEGNCDYYKSTHQAHNIAYVIYTSGSTGNPKGVMIEHRNITNLVLGLEEKIYIHYQQNLAVSLVANYVFDASVQQIFGALVLGHRLCIVPEESRFNGESLLEYYAKYGIDISDGTPIHLALILEYMGEKAWQLYIKHFIIGGDVLHLKVVERFLNVFDNRTGRQAPQITNVYGPTECCVDSTSYTITRENINILEIIPIGMPMPNESMYILGNRDRLQPVGVPGELCISGRGVGRGYLGEKELTAEKFISNPFKKNERLYRTEDLARWLPDGNIEIMGRLDCQVKIRGYRIELGEIESRLLKYEGVSSAVALDREDDGGDKYLCAYIVTDSRFGSFVNPSQLKQYLSQFLPEYMIPLYFMEIEKIPLTPNGKVDRKALPTPILKSQKEYSAPRDSIEMKLVDIWSEVLGLDTLIGIDANFFELGGHSLKATILVSKIHKRLDVRFPLAEVFKAPTIRELAVYIKKTAVEMFSGIEPTEKKEFYPASSAQRRLYIIQQMELKGTSYNVSQNALLEGPLNLEKLDDVFFKLIARHESLRTSFVLIGEETVQVIHEKVKFEIEHYDASHGEEKTFIKNFVRSFDLAKAPLLRVGLIKLKKEKHVLMVDMHHIISDGISLQILVEEFVALYTHKELPFLRLQYSDFTWWQGSEKYREALLKQEFYWKKQFEGEIPVLELPTDYTRPGVKQFEGSRTSFEIGEEEAGALRKLASDEGVTLYMILHAVYYIFLSKVSNQEDIVIGTPTAGRRHADLEHIIGMFVNTLALRNYPSGEMTFRAFLDELKEMSLEAFENQDYQYEELVEEVTENWDVSRNPLFDTMFVWQNIDISEIDIPGLKLVPYKYENETSKFDLILIGMEGEKKLWLTFEYCTKLFKRESIERFITYFMNIVRDVVKNKQQRISQLEIITDEEKNRLLYNFNAAQTEFPRDKTIHQLFEEREDRVSDHIAVIGPSLRGASPSSHLTYHELNKKSNQLAHLLRQKGSECDMIAGIMVERAIEMIIGIFGILKAGGAYLPIDPNYPRERIDFMLNDSGAYILLTADLIFKASQLAQHSRPTQIAQSHHLAYVIYTSGTTGKPKGSLIEHRNVVRLMINDDCLFDFGGEDIWTMFHSYCFDFSVWEMYGALLYGGKLLIIPVMTAKDPGLFHDVLIHEKVTILNQTPVAFYNLAQIESACPGRQLKVRYVIFGGEALKPAKLKQWKEKYPETKLINMFGITETTVHVTFKELEEKDIQNNISIIGKPIPTLGTYVMDRNQKLVPLGVSGELCVGGEGVCRGYLNRPELTNERFLANPYKPNERLYRSGDLGSMSNNGDMEYLGRLDHQVKVSGFRIELGEIENRLLQHGQIKEAVVLAKDDKGGDKSLVAYIVSDGELSDIGLREYLVKYLPDYMIPSHFLQIEMIPLTLHGKIDIKALPGLEIKSEIDYVGPRNPFEEKIMEIWSEVLGVESGIIGIDANFFETRGNSIKAMILIARLYKKFNIKMPLEEIFRSPTVRGVAVFMKDLKREDFSSVEPTEEKEFYTLSAAQRRLYILQQINLHTTNYNMPIFKILEGEVSKKKLEDCLKKLISRHEVLRTSFLIIGGEHFQKIHNHVDFEMGFYDLSDSMSPTMSAETIIMGFKRPFDLSIPPLIRAGLIKTSQEKYILMLDMHHIIADGISMNILVNDWVRLYAGMDLPPLMFQYRDFSEWQANERQKKSIEQQEEYWLKKIGNDTMFFKLPIDYARPEIGSFEGDIVKFEFNKTLSRGIKGITLETGTTLYMVLLAAYNVLLSFHSENEDILVGSPVSGRPYNEFHNTLGIYVNMLVMKNFPGRDKTFKEFLMEVKGNTLEAFRNQEYQFDELIYKLGLKRNISGNPLVETVFTLQNIDSVDTVTEENDDPNFVIKPYPHKMFETKFDLTLDVIEIAGRLNAWFTYATSLFKRATIERMKKNYLEILEQVVANIDMKLKNISISNELSASKSGYLRADRDDFGF